MLCCLKWLRSQFILCWHYSCCSQLSQAVGGTLQLLYLIWSHSPQLHYAMTASESWSIIYLCSTSCQGLHCICLGVFQHAILISIWRAMGGSNFCRSAWKLFSVSVANTIFTGSSSVAYQKMTKIITFREEQGGKACRLFVSGCTAGSTVCLAIKCWAAGWQNVLVLWVSKWEVL